MTWGEFYATYKPRKHLNHREEFRLLDRFAEAGLTYDDRTALVVSTEALALMERDWARMRATRAQDDRRAGDGPVTGRTVDTRPEPDPARIPKPHRRLGRPPRITRETTLGRAEKARRAGMSWRDFAQKHNPRRYLSTEERLALKDTFIGQYWTSRPVPDSTIR